ncbi:MAG: hypothetical protein R3317_01200 [Burkholderiaceae bacterium]|nr:hypothetical protein [Burkholderiaceae bacterium]
MSETEKTQETDTDFKPSEAVPEVDPETVDVIDPEAAEVAEVAEAADGADDDEALDEAEDATPSGPPPGEPSRRERLREKERAEARAAGGKAPSSRRRAPEPSPFDEIDEPEEDLHAEPKASALPQDVRNHLDALSSVVLDSADVASNAAASATGLAAELQASVKTVDAALAAASRQGKIVLGVSGGVLFLSVAVFAAMSMTLQSRINQADAMLLAVGKRVVELNAGIEGIDAMNRSLSSFSDRTDAIMAAQAKLEEQIKTSLGESKALVTNLPTQTAKSVEESNKALSTQVGALDAQMKKQAQAMASLGSQVKDLKGAVGDVEPLKRDVQALITLQKQRYLEALQQQQRAASTASAPEVILQYPNPKNAKTPEKAKQ